MRNCIFLIGFYLVLVTLSSAQTTKIGVELSISADATIKSDIESYVKREFRALSDIDIYATRPDFLIGIVAIKPGSAVAISVVVIEKFDFTAYLTSELRKTNITPAARDGLIKTVAKSESIDQHFLYSDSISDLDQLCKRVVAKIDTDSFESERKFLGLAQTYLESKPPQQDVNSSAPVFEERYVGGNSPPKITVKNISDRTLYLTFSGKEFAIAAGDTQLINITYGGFFDFKASALATLPLSGSREFKRGYDYSWTFFIKKSP